MQTTNDVEAWQLQSRCGGLDTNIFFPKLPKGRGAKKKLLAREEEAKQFCRQCLVRDKCLESILPFDEEGIWGEMNASERKALRISLGIPLKKRPDHNDLDPKQSGLAMKSVHVLLDAE